MLVNKFSFLLFEDLFYRYLLGNYFNILVKPTSERRENAKIIPKNSFRNYNTFTYIYQWMLSTYHAIS